jgi:hypothetical protein
MICLHNVCDVARPMRNEIAPSPASQAVIEQSRATSRANLLAKLRSVIAVACVNVRAPGLLASEGRDSRLTELRCTPCRSGSSWLHRERPSRAGSDERPRRPRSGYRRLRTRHRARDHGIASHRATCRKAAMTILATPYTHSVCGSRAIRSATSRSLLQPTRSFTAARSAVVATVSRSSMGGNCDGIRRWADRGEAAKASVTGRQFPRRRKV